MSDNGDYVERTVDTPEGVRREEVRVVRGSGNAAWWVVLAVAVVAVIGFFVWNASQNSQVDLQAAREQGAAEANLANAAANAQSAASQAAQSAQSAVDSSARVTEGAARSAASQAQSAADNARDAAASEPAAPPPPQ